MRSPGAAGFLRAALFTTAVAAFPFVFGEHWVVNIGIFTVMYMALATSWNILGGFAGYLSLGHAAFFGIGAYAEAIAFEHVGVGSGYRPFLILPLVGIGVGLAAVPLGWASLRVQAATFAIVTISLLFIVQQLAFNLHSLTNGAQGLEMPIAPFPVGTYERPFYLAMAAVWAAAVLFSWVVATGRLGLALFAIRDDEDRARGVGVRVMLAKVVAFALSAGLTGMAGGVWAYYEGFIYPQFAVDPLVTIGAVLMAFLGGRGTIWGPTLGALILVPTQQYLAFSQGASQLYLVAYAAVFLGIMLVMPRGIIPSVTDIVSARRPRGGGRSRGEAAPGVPA